MKQLKFISKYVILDGKKGIVSFLLVTVLTFIIILFQANYQSAKNYTSLIKRVKEERILVTGDVAVSPEDMANQMSGVVRLHNMKSNWILCGNEQVQAFVVDTFLAERLLAKEEYKSLLSEENAVLINSYLAKDYQVGDKILLSYYGANGMLCDEEAKVAGFFDDSILLYSAKSGSADCNLICSTKNAGEITSTGGIISLNGDIGATDPMDYYVYYLEMEDSDHQSASMDLEESSKKFGRIYDGNYFYQDALEIENEAKENCYLFVLSVIMLAIVTFIGYGIFYEVRYAHEMSVLVSCGASKWQCFWMQNFFRMIAGLFAYILGNIGAISLIRRNIISGDYSLVYSLEAAAIIFLLFLVSNFVTMMCLDQASIGELLKKYNR